MNTKVFVSVIVIFVVGACFLYWKYQGKFNKKWQIIFVMCIFIGLTFLVYIMAKSSLKNDIENPKNIQAVPSKYSVIKISDFIDTDEIDSN